MGFKFGAAYVVFGKTTSFPAVIEVNTLTGSNGFAIYGVGNEDVGAPLGRAGDVNGDGIADLVVGAPMPTRTASPTPARATWSTAGVASGPASISAHSWPPTAATARPDSPSTASWPARTPGRPASATSTTTASPTSASATETDDPSGLTDAGRAFIIYGKPSPAPVTKFYVVNDASGDRTYEYSATGTPVEDYALDGGNTAPRGAAATAAGDKVWVVDSNKNVYVYNTSGGLLGSWTAGSLASNATVEGIATNGTDIWIVDARQDKVFRYTGAASRLSGSQNAASSFNLNSGNTSPKDVVTDGTSLWVVNDSSTDKVFKYNLSGSLAGSWTITGAGQQPDGHHARPVGRRPTVGRRQRHRSRLPIRQRRGAAPPARSRPRRASPWPPATPTRRASPTRRRAARPRPEVPTSTERLDPSRPRTSLAVPYQAEAGITPTPGRRLGFGPDIGRFRAARPQSPSHYPPPGWPSVCRSTPAGAGVCNMTVA